MTKPDSIALLDGSFGLGAVRLTSDPEAPASELVIDALCLARNALAVFDTVCDINACPEQVFAGVYLLRQAVFAMEKAEEVAIRKRGAS